MGGDDEQREGRRDMSRRTRTTAEPNRSDFGPQIVSPDTGEVRYAIPIQVEEVAEGTRSTIRRARRADPLNRVEGCTDGMKVAALIYRTSIQHCDAGLGQGPMPWAADRVQEMRHGDGMGVTLLPQERAVSAATWHRRGVQAMGLAASQGVVNWVVVRGLPLTAYDATRKWREGRGKLELLAALDRLAVAYGCA
jgi:hypothetical protein